MKSPGHDVALLPPKISALWLRWFSAYGERYLARHFHALRLRQTPPPTGSLPLVIYLNHASWWDPMICLALRTRLYRDRNSYAPIDAAALEKYAFFRKLGFFPVEQQTARGATQFLRQATTILSSDNSILWLTPEGQFRDVRDRTTSFRPGMAHLAARVEAATYLPLAIEYVFWEERQPEACLNFGEPLRLTNEEAKQMGTATVNQLFETRLRKAQEELAHLVVERDATAFTTLERHRAGVGGVYDVWRRFKSFRRHEAFQPQHGTQ